MKLRIRGNSIRLRLRQGEVRTLVERGVVEERTEFGPAGRTFGYAVRADDAAAAVSAEFTGERIVVRVPGGVAREWSSSEQVGIEASQPAPGGDSLRILIEKDFECLNAPPEESQDGAYPHPRQAKC